MTNLRQIGFRVKTLRDLENCHYSYQIVRQGYFHSRIFLLIGKYTYLRLNEINDQCDRMLLNIRQPSSVAPVANVPIH